MASKTIIIEAVRVKIRRDLPAIIGGRLGQGARVAKTLTRLDVMGVGALRTGAVVAGVWGGISAINNTRAYLGARISKRRAIAATASESVGVGLSASRGLIAGNVARLVVMNASASYLLPFTVGTIVSAGVKTLWDRKASDLIDRIDPPSGQSSMVRAEGDDPVRPALPG